MRIKQKPQFKQMALETAIRNPERYKDILAAIYQFQNRTLNDGTLLELVTHLYREGIVTTLAGSGFSNLSIDEQKAKVRIVNETRRADGGFPSGYASRFWTYVRTLSEFGFVYAEYGEPLLISEVGQKLIQEKIDDQIAFATQAAIFNRKSPFCNVSNDYNYFRFIISVLKRLHSLGRGLSYHEFVLSLFSKNGDPEEFIEEITRNSFYNDEILYKYIIHFHGTHNKQQTILKDYPDAVLRMLKITGFISIQYSSRIKIFINHEKLALIDEIFSRDYYFSETQKTNKKLYFAQYSLYSLALLKITENWTADKGEDVHRKLKLVIDNYSLNLAKIKDILENFQKNKDKQFKYVPDPLKLEFYLSILLYLVYGQDHIVAPNFKTDSLGMPISHAPGNKGDIYVFSDYINWLIEVTLIRNKQQQFNNETTSVIRHIQEDKREKFLSFVAPFIHEDTRTFFDHEIIRMIMEDKKVFIKTYEIQEFIDNTILRQNLNSMKSYSSKILNKLKMRAEEI